MREWLTGRQRLPRLEDRDGSVPPANLNLLANVTNYRPIQQFAFSRKMLTGLSLSSARVWSRKRKRPVGS